jgi:hypothetical protein
MPIRDCKIQGLNGDPRCIALPIKITNPTNNRSFKTYGIIDTGATECYVPAGIATILGYDLTSGSIGHVHTGNGQTNSYKHRMTITIHHPENPENVIFHTLENIEIDCMPDLHVVLLGVSGFLTEFTLKVDFRNGTFSLMR